jgi:hypothetical protein
MTPIIQELLNMKPTAAQAKLENLTEEQLVAPGRVASREDAMLLKAAIYLHHGWLDESHRISQQVKTSNGSYWHAIMHRKEGDFSNSKYWYHRVGCHPIFTELGKDWDPFKFVDECERSPQAVANLERREFELLLEHTCRAAVGKAE